MSKLLINESPLQVLPTLAKEIGLNEAIALQQIHYIVQAGNIGRTIDGRRWIYNSVREWQERHFPFWSEDTVKRTLDNLRDLGLVEAENHNQNKFDKTLWYAIDYAALGKLQESIDAKCPNGDTQDAPEDDSSLQEPIPKDYKEDYNQDKNGADWDGPRWELPPELNTDDFSEAWLRWYVHRTEIDSPLTYTSGLMQLEKCADWGERRAIDAINLSIASGWKNIYEGKRRSNGSGASKREHVEEATDQSGGAYI